LRYVFLFFVTYTAPALNPDRSYTKLKKNTENVFKKTNGTYHTDVVIKYLLQFDPDCTHCKSGLTNAISVASSLQNFSASLEENLAAEEKNSVHQ
jgi:hypothetical protein